MIVQYIKYKILPGLAKLSPLAENLGQNVRDQSVLAKLSYILNGENTVEHNTEILHEMAMPVCCWGAQPTLGVANSRCQR